MTMTISTAERVDTELHRKVLEELEFDPAVDAGKIGIAAENGVVTLTGTVGTFGEKWAAEKAVKRVRGVRGLANELEVELMGMHHMSDTDIAESAVNVLAWDPSLPKSIQVEVHEGAVTLTGTVLWQYQRQLAEKHVRHIGGVRAIDNRIQLRESTLPDDVKKRIKSALHRDIEVEAGNIEVIVDGSDVTLRGTVHSWTERDAATRAAWSVPGVYTLHNDLQIKF
jgi:osmotically-inducible protein OsmY